MLISSTPKVIPYDLHDQIRRHLKVQLNQHFIFLIFKSLVTASFSGVVVSGSTYYPRIAISHCTLTREVHDRVSKASRLQ